MLRFFIFSCFSVLLSLPLRSQILISGKVIDPLSREMLAFVNIGIQNKNSGTISLSDGSFSISIPSKYENDSLTFSLTGYSDLKIPIKNTSKKLVPLFRKPEILQEVTISTTKLREEKFGLKKRNAFHFIDASITTDDIFEIAQVVKLPPAESKLTSLNLFINQSSTDSVTFRINIYSYDGSRPAEKLNSQPILHVQVLNEGWLHCDISKFNLHAKNKIVVAFEFLPSKKGKRSISYEVKLGGRSKTFTRSSSQGEWIIPPHHYLMYLTALVAPGKSGNSEEDENESQATKKILSEFVKDSFSLFIHLPEGYKKNKNKKYPVVLLLDANAYFTTVADFWDPKTNKSLPEVILIGIGYNNALLMDSLRQRDYTFPAAEKTDSCALCGGADKFRSFIQTELISYIYKTYRTIPGEVTLMGHSLGGYFPAWTLITDLKENSTLIKNYICISPSLDYADTYILKAIKPFPLDPINSSVKKCYMAFGEKEEMELTDTIKGVANYFKEFLISAKIESKLEIYPSLTHMETAITGFEKGLLYVLKK